MIDEAHERSVHTDALLALVKQACGNNKRLRAIIASATLQIEKFSAFFPSAGLITIPGRLFPVEIYHSKDLKLISTQNPMTIRLCRIVDIVLSIHREPTEGHILVFVTGQEDILTVQRKIRNELNGDTSLDVLPLYSSLHLDDQRKIFEPLCCGAYRKCIVATNIAETSITVPDVRFVVDCGYVKQTVYDPERHVESLVVVPISQVSEIALYFCHGF